jgi:hypothetical protein
MPEPTGARHQRSPNRSAAYALRSRTVTGSTCAAPTAAAPSPPRTKRILQPIDPTERGHDLPSGQHPVTATRALDLPGRQPGLDANRIDLYRHHRCLQHCSAARRRPAKTVHTKTIEPAVTPTSPSATSMDRPAMVVIQRDGQHPARNSSGRLLVPRADVGWKIKHGPTPCQGIHPRQLLP